MTKQSIIRKINGTHLSICFPLEINEQNSHKLAKPEANAVENRNIFRASGQIPEVPTGLIEIIHYSVDVSGAD